MARFQRTTLLLSIGAIFCFGFLSFKISEAKVNCNVNGAIVTLDGDKCPEQKTETVTASQGAQGTQSGASASSPKTNVDAKDTGNTSTCNKVNITLPTGGIVTCYKDVIGDEKDGTLSTKCAKLQPQCQSLYDKAKEAMESGATNPTGTAGERGFPGSQSGWGGKEVKDSLKDPTPIDIKPPSDQEIQKSIDDAFKQAIGDKPVSVDDPAYQKMLDNLGLSDKEFTDLTNKGFQSDFANSNLDRLTNQAANQADYFSSTLRQMDAFLNSGNYFSNGLSGFDSFAAQNPLSNFGAPTNFQPSGFGGGTFGGDFAGSTFGDGTFPSYVSPSAASALGNSFQSLQPSNFSFDSINLFENPALNPFTDITNPAAGLSIYQPDENLLSRSLSDGTLSAGLPETPLGIADVAFNDPTVGEGVLTDSSTLEALAGADISSASVLDLTQPGSLGGAEGSIPGVLVSNLTTEQLVRAVPTFNDVIREVQNGNYFQAARLLGQNTASTISDSAARYGSTLREFFRLPGTVLGTAPVPPATSDVLAQKAALVDSSDLGGFDIPEAPVKDEGPTLAQIQEFESGQKAREDFQREMEYRNALERNRQDLGATTDSLDKTDQIKSQVEASKKETFTFEEGGKQVTYTKEELLNRLDSDKQLLAQQQSALQGQKGLLERGLRNAESITAARQSDRVMVDNVSDWTRGTILGKDAFSYSGTSIVAGEASSDGFFGDSIQVYETKTPNPVPVSGDAVAGSLVQAYQERSGYEQALVDARSEYDYLKSVGGAGVDTVCLKCTYLEEKVANSTKVIEQLETGDYSNAAVADYLALKTHQLDNPALERIRQFQQDFSAQGATDLKAAFGSGDMGFLDRAFYAAKGAGELVLGGAGSVTLMAFGEENLSPRLSGILSTGGDVQAYNETRALEAGSAVVMGGLLRPIALNPGGIGPLRAAVNGIKEVPTLATTMKSTFTGAIDDLVPTPTIKTLGLDAMGVNQPLAVTRGIDDVLTSGAPAAIRAVDVPEVSAVNRGVVETLDTNMQLQAIKTIADYESLVAREAVTARGTLDAKSLSFQRANVEARLADSGLTPVGVGSEVKLLEGGPVPLKVANPGYSIDEILARGYSTAAKSPDVMSRAARYMNESFLKDFLATPVENMPVTTNLSRTTVPLNQFQSFAQSPIGRAIQGLNAVSAGFVPTVDALASVRPVAAIVRTAPDIAAPAISAGTRITTGADDIARIAARYEGVNAIAQEQRTVAGALRTALENPAPTNPAKITGLTDSSVLETLQAGRLTPIQALKAVSQADVPTVKAIDIDSVAVQDVTPVTTGVADISGIESALGAGDFKAAENAAQGSVNVDAVRNTLSPQLQDGGVVTLGDKIKNVAYAVNELVNPYYWVAPASAGEVKSGIASTYMPGAGGIEGGPKGAYTVKTINGSDQVARLSNELQPFDVVRICNGSECIVRYVGDKGYWPGRTVDLPREDAVEIGCPANSLCSITYEVLGRPDASLVRTATQKALTNQAGLAKIAAREEATRVAEALVKQFQAPATAPIVARALPEFTPIQVADATGLKEAQVVITNAVTALKTIETRGVRAAQAADLPDAIVAANQAQGKIEEIAASVVKMVQTGSLPAVEAKVVTDAAEQAKVASAGIVKALDDFDGKGIFEKMTGQAALKKQIAALKQEVARSVGAITQGTQRVLVQSPVGQTVAGPSIPTFIPAAIPDTNPLVSTVFTPGALTQARAAKAYSTQSAKISEYQNMTGAQLATFERSALLNIGAELEARGYKVDYVVRSGSFKQTNKEEPPQAYRAVVAHLPEGNESAAFYVKTSLLKEGFHTTYSMGIDCTNVSCTITIAVPREGDALPLRDNHVSRKDNRLSNPADNTLYNWNALGVVVPGEEGMSARPLTALEARAAADIGQLLAKELGIKRAVGHVEQDHKSEGEGVALARALEASMQGVTPVMAEGALRPLVGSVGKTIRAVTGANSHISALPPGAVVASAKLQLASVGEVQVGAIKNGATTYAHWLNEGGAQSGEITPEVLKRQPAGSEISVPHTYGVAKIEGILNSCNGCKVKFYIESNPKETNDAAYDANLTDQRAILERIQKTAAVRDQLIKDGYRDRMVNSVEMDAARDYFDRGDITTPILHAQWLKANGFEYYEPKSLLEEQIQQIIKGSGIAIRSAVFEDPKQASYLEGIVQSIQSGRPTTVSFKEVATPGYTGDTREEAVAFAQKYAAADNLTVVYSPKDGIPEFIKFGQAGTHPLQVASLSSLSKPEGDTSDVRVAMPGGEKIRAVYRQGSDSWNISLAELKALTPETRNQVQFTRTDGSTFGYTSFGQELQKSAETARAKAVLDARRQSVFAQALGVAQSAVRYIGAQANAVVAQTAPGRYAVATKITPQQAAAEAALKDAKAKGTFSDSARAMYENGSTYVVDPTKPNQKFTIQTETQNSGVTRGEPGQFVTARPLQSEEEMKAVAATLKKILPDSYGYITQPIAIQDGAGSTVIITPKATQMINQILKDNGFHEMQPVYTNKTFADRLTGNVSSTLRARHAALLAKKADIESGVLAGTDLARFYRSIGLKSAQNALRSDVLRAKLLAERIMGSEFYTIAATEGGHQSHHAGDHFDAYFSPLDRSIGTIQTTMANTPYTQVNMITKTVAAAAWVKAAREVGMEGLPCIGTYGGAGMHFGSCGGTRGWDIDGNGGGKAISDYRDNASKGIGGYSFEQIKNLRDNGSLYAQVNRELPQQTVVAVRNESGAQIFSYAVNGDLPVYRITQISWGGSQTGGGTAPTPGGDNTTGGVGGTGIGGDTSDAPTGALPTGGGAIPPTDAQILEALAQGALPPGARIDGVVLVGAAGAGGLALLTGNEEQDLEAIKKELEASEGKIIIDPRTLGVYVQKPFTDPALAAAGGQGGARSAFADSLRRIMSGQNPFAPQGGQQPTPASGAGAPSGGSGGGASSGGGAPSGGSGAGGVGSSGVLPPGSPSITSFSCNPTAALKTGTTTISWGCSNTVATVGTNFATNGALSGTAIVTVSTTTTYTLQCGNVSQSCTVQSIAPKAVVVANPSRIPRGGSTNIGWVTSETEKCTLYGSAGFITDGGRSGVTTVNNISASTRFVLVCGTKAGVPFSKEIDVYVDNEQVISQGAQVAPGSSVGSAESYQYAADDEENAGYSSTPITPASSGTFTATDTNGNTVSLCDPSVGIDRFTRCLMGQ